MRYWAVAGCLSAHVASAAALSALAGVYAIDPARTELEFRLDLLGMFALRGDFSGVAGRLTLDTGHPEASALIVAVPVASLAAAGVLAAQLRSARWLDAADYPTMRFNSTAVRMVGPQDAEVTGTLTLHGVARQLTLHAHLRDAGPDPGSGQPEIAFSAEGHLRRSAFGMNAMPLLVGDDVRLTLRGAFARR